MNFIALSGPTIPASPNPAASVVTSILKKLAMTDVTTDVNTSGTIIIGCFSKFGMSIFIAPRKTAIGTPLLFTLNAPTMSNQVPAIIPIFAAPAASPVKPIAIESPTVEIGETTIIAKAAAINTYITIGWKFVKLLMR